MVVLVAIALALAWAFYQKGYVDENKILYYAVLIPSIILHEISHGAIAFVFGDRTAKNAGRLSLNPLRHIDPWGTLIIPAVLSLTVGLGFGYAKPVPVNVSRMSRNQAMLTGLVGPFTNIVLALGTAGALWLLYPDQEPFPVTMAERLLVLGVVANCVVAAFNLIPIPPLDGAAVVERFLPAKHMAAYYQFRQYSMVLILAVAFMGQGLLGQLFSHVVQWWATLLPWTPSI